MLLYDCGLLMCCWCGEEIYLTRGGPSTAAMFRSASTGAQHSAPATLLENIRNKKAI